jgi:hypothetical protein
MFDDKLVFLDSLLKRAGHETWGWHIYRCTYSSDDDWSEFMKRLESMTQRMVATSASAIQTFGTFTTRVRHIQLYE